MKLSEIMTRRVVSVELDDRLETVREIFGNAHIHHVLVLEEGRLFGVVSDRDLFKALSPHLGTASETPRDGATLNKRVHQIMTRRPICLHADAPVEDAIRLLVDNPISCVPVVDEDHKPIGILSWRDILRTMLPASASPAQLAQVRANPVPPVGPGTPLPTIT